MTHGACHPATRGAARRVRWRGCALALVCCWTSVAQAQDLAIRVRVEVSHPGAAATQLTLASSRGTLAELRSLGMESDAIRQHWIDQGAVRINLPAGRTNAALECTYFGTAEDSLRLLQEPPGPEEGPAPPLAIDLGQLLRDPVQRQAEGSGLKVTVQRVPGDWLRVYLVRPSLVFQSGEAFRLEVEPYALPSGASGRFTLEWRLEGPANVPSLGAEQELSSPENGPSWGRYPIEMALPAAEGVYNLTLQVKGRQRLGRRATVAERKVQLLILESAPPPDPFPNKQADEFQEIDSTRAGWRQWVLQQARTLGGREPFEPQELGTWQHASGPFAELPPVSVPDAHGLLRKRFLRGPATPGQQFVPLEIRHPGVYHTVSIEYPTDRAQRLAFCLLEQDERGEWGPAGIATGIDLEHPAAAPQRAVHTLHCWPRTKRPILWLRNLREDGPAWFGKIRVTEVRAGAPSPMFRRSQSAGEPFAGSARLMAAQLDALAWPRQFAAPRSVDPATGQLLADWNTFYVAGKRLIEQLRHAGNNALFLTVQADGSALYPSFSQPTATRYDSGAWFSNGQDPIPKDVVEFLFRLCDREGIHLIPVVRFDSPLPTVEAALRGDASAGIELVGPRGVLRAAAASDALAPPAYNPLDPRVQEAMREVVREISRRYGQHRAFRGVAIEISGRSFNVLPGLAAGLDDATWERFQAEAGLSAPSTGAERLAHRAQAVTTGNLAQSWSDWRTERMEAFYQACLEEATWARTDAQLYLLCTDLWRNDALARQWRPMLPRRKTWERFWPELGLPADGGLGTRGIVLLRPSSGGWPTGSAAESAAIDFNDAAEIDRWQRDMPQSAANAWTLPVLEPLPAGASSSAWRSVPAHLLAVDAPARALIHALAVSDLDCWCDDTGHLPRAKTNAALIAAFRTLPSGRFETLPGVPQPVVVRWRDEGGKTVFYAVNDYPWTARLRLRLQAPLTGQPRVWQQSTAAGEWYFDGDGGEWTVALPPYGFAAFWTPQVVRLSDPRVLLENTVAEELEQRLQSLEGLSLALQTPVACTGPTNAGFEETNEAGLPAQWTIAGATAEAAASSSEDPHAGERSLRLTSSGALVSLRSEEFPPPSSGRLTVAAWVRALDGTPPLTLGLEGQQDGQPFYRYARLGSARGAAPLDTAWGQYLFQVADLPGERLGKLRVRLDMEGAGAIAVDQVQLYDLIFSKEERIDLDSRIIGLARAKFQRGEVADCLRLLEGYWPQYLARHVSAVPVDAAQAETADARKPPAAANGANGAESSEVKQEAAPRTGWVERLKGWLPERWR